MTEPVTRIELDRMATDGMVPRSGDEFNRFSLT